jgi:hypothetical protein
VLLTGDADAVARGVARAVGIAELRAGVLPADKAAEVKRLQAAGHRVAMVGDGILANRGSWEQRPSKAETQLVWVGAGDSAGTSIPDLSSVSAPPPRVFGHDPAVARLLGTKERKQAEAQVITLTRRPRPERLLVALSVREQAA